MPLNYSKWDQLELSDDSDIEGHPNVDKKSLIRWKQRDIHEKRQERKMRIQALTSEIACNGVLRPRIEKIASDLTQNGPSYLSSLVERLRTKPSPDAPPSNAPNQPTYDDMILSLLLQVSNEAKIKSAEAKGDEAEALNLALQSILAEHLTKLDEHTEKLKIDLAAEEKEQRKHITSDDIHEGFDSKYVPAAPSPALAPIKNSIAAKPIKNKSTKSTTFEVLNPSSSSTSEQFTAATDVGEEGDDLDEDGLPELTPTLEAFSKIPLWAFEKSWEFVQQHSDLFAPGGSDALLVTAFRSQSQSLPSYAKQCVHQSLLLQYCDKLGRDGVRVFFKKMIADDKRARSVFVKDVEDTYEHLVRRVQASQEGNEQIQLVPENPNQKITFNVPEGPPPADLRLEGPGTEDMDIEEVRQVLQTRWDIFSQFDPKFQEALKEGELDGVNRVLGAMDVKTAEEMVNLLDMAGILNFGEGGVRDETGKGAP